MIGLEDVRSGLVETSMLFPLMKGKQDWLKLMYVEIMLMVLDIYG